VTPGSLPFRRPKRPGKYLVPAPGQQVPDDVAGFQVRHSPTFNIFLGVRLTDPDPQGAKEALAQLRMYAYAQRDNQPKTEIFDAGMERPPAARDRVLGAAR
jgi:hypothetical protein